MVRRWIGWGALILWCSSLWAFPKDAFTRLTVFNAKRDAEAALHSCGVDPVKVRQAIEAFRTLIESCPDSGYAAESLYWMGELYTRLKDSLHALKCWEEILQKYPHSDWVDDAARRLIRHYRGAGDEENLRRALKALVEARPMCPEADNLLWEEAQRLEREGKLVEAVSAFLRLAYAYPDSDSADDALWRAAQICERSKNYAYAARIYRRLYVLFPYSDQADDAALQAARCLREAGRLEDALKQFEFFLRSFPASERLNEARREAAQVLQTLLRQRGKGQVVLPLKSLGALGQGLVAKEVEPIARGLFEEAKKLRAQKKLFDAIKVYRRVVEKCVGSDYRDDAQLAIGECYQELSTLARQLRQVYLPEREAEAIEVWEHAGGKGLPDPKGLLEKAISSYMKLVEEFFGSNLRDDALERVVKCYHEAGDSKGEMMAALRFLAEFPFSDRAGEVAKAVEEMLRKSGGPICIKPWCLIKAFEPLVWAGPANDLYDDALYYAACGRLALGHLDQARMLLRKLAEGWDDSPLKAYAQFLLARLEDMAGKPEEAARNYKLLAQNFPHSGLADDAAVALQGEPIDVNRYGSYAYLREAVERIKPFGADITPAGPVVVVMPIIYSPFLRSYNLPNLLEAAAYEVAKAMGLSAPDRLMAMAVDPMEEEPKVGSLMVVPGKVARVEPPEFEDAFKPLALLYAWEHTPELIRKVMPSFPEAFAEFAATYLRYNLVRETREVIGSPEAEKAAAPFNVVRRKRDQARNALHRALRKGTGLDQMDALAGCGFLFALVEQAGGYKENVLDWGGIVKLIEVARKVPREAYEGKDKETLVALLACCVGEALNRDGASLLRRMGLKVNPELTKNLKQSLFPQPEGSM